VVSNPKNLPSRSTDTQPASSSSVLGTNGFASYSEPGDDSTARSVSEQPLHLTTTPGDHSLRCLATVGHVDRPTLELQGRRPPMATIEWIQRDCCCFYTSARLAGLSSVYRHDRGRRRRRRSLYRRRRGTWRAIGVCMGFGPLPHYL
jgi:hypothetical protein